MPVLGVSLIRRTARVGIRYDLQDTYISTWRQHGAQTLRQTLSSIRNNLNRIGKKDVASRWPCWMCRLLRIFGMYASQTRAMNIGQLGLQEKHVRHKCLHLCSARALNTTPISCAVVETTQRLRCNAIHVKQPWQSCCKKTSIISHPVLPAGWWARRKRMITPRVLMWKRFSTRF